MFIGNSDMILGALEEPFLEPFLDPFFEPFLDPFLEPFLEPFLSNDNKFEECLILPLLLLFLDPLGDLDFLDFLSLDLDLLDFLDFFEDLLFAINNKKYK